MRLHDILVYINEKDHLKGHIVLTLVGEENRAHLVVSTNSDWFSKPSINFGCTISQIKEFAENILADIESKNYINFAAPKMLDLKEE